MASRRRRSASGPALALGVAAALAGTAAVAISGGPEDAARAGGRAGLEALAAHPDRLRGDEVTVVGAVDERYGPSTFAIVDAHGAEAIVLAPPTVRGGRTITGTIRVTGTAGLVGADLRPRLRNDYPVRVGDARIQATHIERGPEP